MKLIYITFYISEIMNFKKITNILNKTEKKKLFLITGLLLLSIIIELIGIGIILPILEIFIDDKSDILNKVFTYLNLNDGYLNKNKLIKFSLILLVSIYLFKLLSLLTITYLKNKFFSDLCSDLSAKLFKLYLNQDYKFFLNKNSSELVRNITGETSLFCFGVISSLSTLFNEIILLLCVAILLLYVEPIGAIVIFTFFTFFSLFYLLLTKKKLSNWGKLRQEHDTKRYQHLFQGFGSIKEIILLKNSSFFANKFDYDNRKSFKMLMLSNTLNQFPRLGLEFLTIIIFALGSYALIYNGKDFINTIPTIGLFVVSAFRLLPSLSKIISSLQTLKYNKAAIVTLNNQFDKLKLTEKDTKEYSKINFKKISIKNLKFRYEEQKNYLINDLNIEMNKNSIIGISGVSGSGKSTLVNLITGLLKPSAGQIYVDNNDIKLFLNDWQKNIGYVSQSVFLLDDTIKNNIALGVEQKNFDKKHYHQCIKNSSLDEFIDSLPNKEDTLIGENGTRISGGQKQRIGIARALYFKPSLLIFDESTNALDEQTEKQIIQTIKNLGKEITIILISHKVELLDICDKKIKF
jgi:ATP-binding cassette, subfamily B, bacterial PglK